VPVITVATRVRFSGPKAAESSELRVVARMYGSAAPGRAGSKVRSR
jgi:hypothetical protein